MNINMKTFTEVREINSNNNIEDILYFEDEGDADDYIDKNNNKCIKKKYYLISKGRDVEEFKKEKKKINALNKLSEEERKLLGFE